MNLLKTAGRGLVVAAFAFSGMGFAGVSGFVDAQMWVPTGTGNNPTFRLNDGAVYFSDSMGSTSVMVDIPFFGLSTTTNTLTLATTKAQAYVTQKYDFGMTWALGQFDTIYGYEGNDSVAFRHAEAGLIKANLQRWTHAGFMASYVNGPIEVKALISNPTNQGLRNGNNFEYGGQVKFTHDAMYVAAGYLHRKDATSTNSEMLADFIAGYKMSGMNVDLNIVLNKAPGTVAGTQPDSGFTAGLWLGYDVNKEWNMATRFEYAKKALANTAASTGYSNTVFQWTVGPQYKFNEKLATKLDFSLLSTKLEDGGTSTTSTSGGISAVYKF